LAALATVATQVHQDRDAYRHAHDAERLATDSGNEEIRIEAVHIMAMTAPTLAQALTLGERASAAYRVNGNHHRLALLQTSLAYKALMHDDDAAAARLSEQALTAAESLGDPLVRSLAHGNAGLIALLSGDPGRASAMFVRQLEFVARYRFSRQVFEVLNGMAMVAAAQARDEVAGTLAGAADSSSMERQDPVIARRLEARFVVPARQRIGSRRWETAYTAGRELTLEQALALGRRAADVTASDFA
jgi:hypothetical protein